MRRRRDPRVVVLGVATLAVFSGVAVGTAARWPVAGVVVSFVLVGTIAVVAADTPAVRRRIATGARRVRGRISAVRSADDAAPPVPADVTSADDRLRRAGVVRERDGDSPRLSPDFERGWRRRIVSVGDRSDDAAALADLLSVSESDVDLSWNPEERALVASVRGRCVGRWPSRAAFVADVTAVEEFRARYPEWWTLTSTARTHALTTLRLCLDWCPVCDGTLSVRDEPPSRTDSDGPVVVCDCCRARLFAPGLETGQFDAAPPLDAGA